MKNIILFSSALLFIFPSCTRTTSKSSTNYEKSTSYHSNSYYKNPENYQYDIIENKKYVEETRTGSYSSQANPLSSGSANATPKGSTSCFSNSSNPKPCVAEFTR